MKKSILLISLCFLGISCSSDDNTEVDKKDPVFESEYTPLASFDDLNRVYNYQGVKIGDRPFGTISSKNCLSGNTISFFLSNDGVVSNDSIVFMSYKVDEKTSINCELDFMRVLRDVKLVNTGIINVDITDISYVYVKVPVKDTINNTSGWITRTDTIRKQIYKGDLEIGHQGGYLRMEDEFSRYSGKDKVYQYFKTK